MSIVHSHLVFPSLCFGVLLFPGPFSLVFSLYPLSGKKDWMIFEIVYLHHIRSHLWFSCWISSWFNASRRNRENSSGLRVISRSSASRSPTERRFLLPFHGHFRIELKTMSQNVNININSYHVISNLFVKSLMYYHVSSSGFGYSIIQWNLSVTTTSIIRFITCALFSSVF